MTAETQVDAIDAARRLAEAGIPIFLAPPSKERPLGFKLPTGWELTKPDPAVVDKWKPGWALCAVMGHLVDAIDIDPRNGGSLKALENALGGELPKVYGRASTPSGGEHYLVASLGVRKVQDLVPGVDVQAGNAEGVGRGFIFLAPTVRTSKETGEQRSYTWELDPDVGQLLLEEDTSGSVLRSLILAKQTHKLTAEELIYDGPVFDDLTEEQQEEAIQYVNDQLELWRERFEDAETWEEGVRDDMDRGWESLAYQFAWALAKLAACPWTVLNEDGASLAYYDILPSTIDEACPGKWWDGIVVKASEDVVDIPPWVGRTTAQEDFAQELQAVKKRPPCDHTNESDVTRWLIANVGTGPLSGLFRRGDEDLVYTPRVGEEGYQAPENEADMDGPAQVRRMTPLRLASRVDATHRVFRVIPATAKVKAKEVDVVFKKELAERAMADLDRCRNLPRISLITHTPIVRADGTVLDEPGYDEESRVLYLPEKGVGGMPLVPDEPTETDVAAARELLLDMLVDFPFVTDHDRANYLGCLALPLLRIVLPPPYQMLIIGAPQRGSGKSLLAYIMRTVHGGVFRSEIPSNEEERRKVISSILDGTSAPIVQFDNVNGVLKSSTLDGLLTSAVWTDRRLGVSQNIVASNDRLWVVTGNNVTIGGDMDRRVLWSTINADLEHPELRPPGQFKHSDLEGWVREHRGDVLHALLVLIRDWVVKGRPVQPAPTSDSFGTLQQVLRGILHNAGIPGTLGHVDSKPDRPDLEAEEWVRFLQAAHRVMGEDSWTVKELLLKMSDFEEDGLEADELPGELADRVKATPQSVAKSLGKMLSSRQGQWAGRMKVVNSGGGGKHAVQWKVEAR